jgi:RNA polymerase sigma-70 factor (family 1)
MDKKDVQEFLLPISNGDKQAFDQLFLRSYDKLVQFAQHLMLQTDVAEDVVSEVFTKLWLRRDQLTSINNLEGYLYTAVKNGCFDQRKSRRTVIDMEEVQLSYVIPAETHTQELYRLLKAAILALPEQRRLVFLLIKEQGKTSNEVAYILDISQRTVENHLYKAVKTLAAIISRYLGYDPQHPTKKPKGTNVIFFF